jgi:hypothetical protein
MCYVRPPGLRPKCKSGGDGTCDDDDDDELPSPLHMGAASTTCVGWTSQGAQLERGHPAMKPYYVWVLERAELQEDLIFHENSKRFDAQELLHAPLAASHSFASACFGAEDLGLPWARKRTLSVGWKNTKLVWMGSDPAKVVEDFLDMFRRVPVLSGDDYLVDDEHVVQEIRELCSTRGHWYDEATSMETVLSAPDTHMYNPTQRQHKGTYEAMYMGHQRAMHPSGCFQMDLNQNPLERPSSCGGFVPRMCTHGCLRSMLLGRTFTKREVMYPLGLPKGGGWLSGVIDGWSYNEVPPSAALGSWGGQGSVWVRSFVTNNMERASQEGSGGDVGSNQFFKHEMGQGRLRSLQGGRSQHSFL